MPEKHKSVALLLKNMCRTTMGIMKSVKSTEPEIRRNECPHLKGWLTSSCTAGTSSFIVMAFMLREYCKTSDYTECPFNVKEMGTGRIPVWQSKANKSAYEGNISK